MLVGYIAWRISRTPLIYKLRETKNIVLSIMKIGIAALVAGIIGAVGIILFLVAFGTEYWLLATETCGSFDSNNETLDIDEESDEDMHDYEVIYHHEGFFWRCWFFGDDPQTSVWRYWLMNQPHPKRCIPGYLFPMQIAVGPFPHPSFDATAETRLIRKSRRGDRTVKFQHKMYRGFWTIFIILGAASSLSGGFLLVYGVPFASAVCYKVGGGFLMISEGIFSCSVYAKASRIQITLRVLMDKCRKQNIWYVPVIPDLPKTFIMKECCILSEAFQYLAK
ncbi:transmembrane protein [Cricetulus griseus]|nr:transmembrane protein [Cricetulus griseus]